MLFFFNFMLSSSNILLNITSTIFLKYNSLSGDCKKELTLYNLNVENINIGKK